MGDVNDLHDNLKNLIEKSWLRFNFAILWECSSQRRVLRFKDGYHRGREKPNEVRIMGSYVRVAEHVSDVESEWFFKISMSQYFDLNEDMPGQIVMYSNPVWVNTQDTNTRYKWGMWERTKLAHQFGIRTFLCIPLKEKKVLELASTEIIPYSIEWIQHNVDLIDPIGTPSSPLDYVVTRQQQQQQQERLLLAQQQQQFRQLVEQQQKLVQQNQQHQQLRLWNKETKNRGKEKISNSKCSWTLLTESSDRGTDRTFSCSHDYSGPS